MEDSQSGSSKEIQAGPVFRRNLNAYKAKKRFIVNQGGSRCFKGDTKVITSHGPKAISEIKVGELVITPNGPKQVITVIQSKNTKKTVKVRLKNGSDFICTEDHLFYFRGDWISIKHILSLWHEENTKF